MHCNLQVKKMSNSDQCALCPFIMKIKFVTHLFVCTVLLLFLTRKKYNVLSTTSKEVKASRIKFLP